MGSPQWAASLEAMNAMRRRVWRSWMPRRFRWRLMALVTLCLVLSIFGYGTYMAYEQATLAREDLAQEMAGMAQNLAAISAHFLATNDLAELETAAKKFGATRSIQALLVTDAAGKPIVELRNNEGHWSPVFNNEPISLPVGNQPILQSAAGAIQGDADAAWHPIEAGSVLGWARISFQPPRFSYLVYRIWKQSLWVVFLSCATAIALLAALLRPSMRALEEATRFAHAIDQDRGQILKPYADGAEFEALGVALNTALIRLRLGGQELANRQFALDQHAIVSITDLNGRIEYVNDRFCEISGFTRTELLGENHRIINSGHHATEVFNTLWQTISGGGVWIGELKNRRRDGSNYWVDVTIVPLTGADGMPTRYIGIRTDITALKMQQDALELATLEAQTANLAKSRFLATMSHEIRTPMNGVLGMAQLLLMPKLTEDQRCDYARTILSSGQVLLTLLNDILDISKIEAGKFQMEASVFEPAAVLTEISTLFLGAAQAKGLRLQYQWHGLPTQCFQSDSHRLRQMLSNLVGNAIKFTPRGNVRIEARQIDCEGDSALLEFSVSDSGIGIAKDKQSLLFKPFSQADSSTTREFGGSGLGLSIVSRLSKAMGGDAGVESEAGQGSRFWFQVRVQTVLGQERRSTDGTIQAQAPHATNEERLSGHVLVAEDNPVNARLIELLLETLGVTMTLARDGQQAVDAVMHGVQGAIEKHPALIVMDVQMPVMNGHEATRVIRQWEAEHAKPRIPIIALTANAFEEDRQRCMDAGMDDFLTKPITISVLKTMLSRWLADASASQPSMVIEARPVDVSAFISVVNELAPLLEKNKFAALGRFKELKSVVEGTALAHAVDEMNGQLQQMNFAVVLGRLRQISDTLVRQSAHDSKERAC